MSLGSPSDEIWGPSPLGNRIWARHAGGAVFYMWGRMNLCPSELHGMAWCGRKVKFGAPLGPIWGQGLMSPPITYFLPQAWWSKTNIGGRGRLARSGGQGSVLGRGRQLRVFYRTE